ERMTHAHRATLAPRALRQVRTIRTQCGDGLINLREQELPPARVLRREKMQRLLVGELPQRAFELRRGRRIARLIEVERLQKHVPRRMLELRMKLTYEPIADGIRAGLRTPVSDEALELGAIRMALQGRLVEERDEQVMPAREELRAIVGLDAQHVRRRRARWPSRSDPPAD